MNPCDKLLQTDEFNSIDFNEDIFYKVFQEFLNNTNIKFNFLKEASIYEQKISYLSKIFGIKYQYICNSNICNYEHIDLFFKILNKYNYNMKYEFKDAILFLSSLENPNNNKKTIQDLMISPVIQDISFNGKDKFTIYSEQYGNISFKLASYYFRNNNEITNYMKNNQLNNECHRHTYFLKDIFTDFYATTSLCPHCFGGVYYHSYTQDKDKNYIIDLCYNSIISKNDYYKIWNPEEISVILNSDIDKEIKLTDTKSRQDSFRYKLLNIALYKRYLNNIGYNGSLEDAPYIKIR